MILERFSELTRAWFTATFAAPTPAQEQGWAAISRGEHSLILAPTGSGKTLAAFLWAIDRLATTPPPADEKRRCRVLYVSPLKALTYDVERNLRAPLTGIALEAERAGIAPPVIRVATRTGDTPQADRRDLARRPPDILVTTPESLYLMLTSQARDVLASVEHVIVDEIHAVAATKRGSHLALSLERLERLVDQAGNPPPQRIGLSATQRPLDELARFLGGRRPVTIVDAGIRKRLELQVVVPVEDMGELGRPVEGQQPGDPEVRTSIWPALHPVLLDLIRAHRSTLVFVNSRRLAERLAARLNELAGEELVRAHHGSIAREQRLQIQEDLNAGRLPALVASTWRIEEIRPDRVIVTPAPGEPGKMPFWHGDAVGRPIELGRAIGAFLREMEPMRAEDAVARLRADHALDELAARNLVAYLADQRAVTGSLPTDRTIVVERFRDELGDWQVVLLTPFGGRVHAPWSMAIGARLRERHGLEVQSLWSDDGIAVRLPEGVESDGSTI